MNVHRPWTIQIETVRGCNMRCDFCANYSLPKKREFMDVNKALLIAEQIKEFGPKQKIVFAMRGEPTLHPEFEFIVGMFRTILPEAYLLLLTNGLTITSSKAVSYLRAGVNIIAIDCYNDSVEKFTNKLSDLSVGITGYRDINIWTYQPPYTSKVVLIDDLIRDHKNTRSWCNQCDYIPDRAYGKYNIPRPVPGGIRKKCVTPFRELSIRYDGSVTICCHDWVGEQPLHIVNDQNRLYDFWFHDKRLNYMRVLLANGIRDFHPCNRCTFFGGFRQGFLPKIDLSKQQVTKIIKELNDEK